MTARSINGKLCIVKTSPTFSLSFREEAVQYILIKLFQLPHHHKFLLSIFEFQLVHNIFNKLGLCNVVPPLGGGGGSIIRCLPASFFRSRPLFVYNFFQLQFVRVNHYMFDLFSAPRINNMHQPIFCLYHRWIGILTDG